MDKSTPEFPDGQAVGESRMSYGSFPVTYQIRDAEKQLVAGFYKDPLSY